MTGVDLDELERLVAASDARESEDSLAHARASIALRNAATELLALAREALAARETYRLEVPVDAPAVRWTKLIGLEGLSLRDARLDARRIATSREVRIVRERDGEVVS